MGLKSIEVREIKNGSKNLVEVILNRPQLRNAFDPNMIEEITQAFLQISQSKEWRGVILRGNGKSFCAGADLQWMESMIKYTYAENEKDSQKLFLMFEAIAQCPHPVIGVAHGAAMGGALGLLAACDIVIAEQNTQFCFSEVKLGIAPAVISAFILKKIPSSLVTPWMITGRVFNIQQAVQMGLVHDHFLSEKIENIDAEIQKALESWKLNLMEAAPEAVRATKKLVKNLVENPWSVQKTMTTQLIAERRVSAEGQEGLRSFLEKKSPAWRL